jgi:hypothetical protein
MKAGPRPQVPELGHKKKIGKSKIGPQRNVGSNEPMYVPIDIHHPPANILWSFLSIVLRFVHTISVVVTEVWAINMAPSGHRRRWPSMSYVM